VGRIGRQRIFIPYTCRSDSAGQGGELIDGACVLEAAAKALLPGPLPGDGDDGRRRVAGRSDTGR